jgi:hypothetical protein
MKRWTFTEMVRTDIFRRGVPWAILIKRTGTIETDLNVRSGQKACVVLTGLLFLAGLACFATAWAGLAAIACLAAIIGLNARFFAFLLRKKGWAFACAAVAPHLVYYACCGLSVVIAQAHWWASRHDRRLVARTGLARTHRGDAAVHGPAWIRWARRLSRGQARSQ